MIARCLYKSGRELDSPLPDSFFYTPETVFHLQIDQEYQTFGLGIWRTGLFALVLDETKKPNWLPVGLFDFGEQPLPAGWEFAVRDGKAASGAKAPDHWVAIWGYPDLVRDPDHSDRLVERDQEALAIFFREVTRAAHERR